MIELKLIEAPGAYAVLAAAALIDAYLLYVFFTKRKKARLRSEAPGGSLSPSRG